MIQEICPFPLLPAASWKQAPGRSLRLRITGEIRRPRNPGYDKYRGNGKTPGKDEIEDRTADLSLKGGLYAVEDPRCRKKR